MNNNNNNNFVCVCVCDEEESNSGKLGARDVCGKIKYQNQIK